MKERPISFNQIAALRAQMDALEYQAGRKWGKRQRGQDWVSKPTNQLTEGERAIYRKWSALASELAELIAKENRNEVNSRWRPIELRRDLRLDTGIEEHKVHFGGAVFK